MAEVVVGASVVVVVGASVVEVVVGASVVEVVVGASVVDVVVVGASVVDVVVVGASVVDVVVVGASVVDVVVVGASVVDVVVVVGASVVDVVVVGASVVDVVVVGASVVDVVVVGASVVDVVVEASVLSVGSVGDTHFSVVPLVEKSHFTGSPINLLASTVTSYSCFCAGFSSIDLTYLLPNNEFVTRVPSTTTLIMLFWPVPLSSYLDRSISRESQVGVTKGTCALTSPPFSNDPPTPAPNNPTVKPIALVRPIISPPIHYLLKVIIRFTCRSCKFNVSFRLATFQFLRDARLIAPWAHFGP